MSVEERLVADSEGIGTTLGPHPMAYRREAMNKLRVTPAAKLAALPNGRRVRVAGNVIVRQRPSTARGVTFLSIEDETGISNAVVMPDLFEQQRVDIVSHPWLMVEGKLQNVDNVVPVPRLLDIAPASHDFH